MEETRVGVKQIINKIRGQRKKRMQKDEKRGPEYSYELRK